MPILCSEMLLLQTMECRYCSRDLPDDVEPENMKAPIPIRMSRTTSANLAPSHIFPQAWQTFKRRPWLSIGMWIVYVFFSGQGGAAGNGGDQSNSGGDIGPDEWVWLRAILMGVLAYLLVMIIVAGPIRGGYDLAVLRLFHGDETVAFRNMFAGFSKFRTLFLTFLLYVLVILVGLILLIVPGMILLLALWPAFLLVMEDDLGPVDALKGAWALTRGYKGKILVLGLVGFAVVITGILVLGLGLFVAGPVIEIARMATYHELRLAAK